MLNSYACLVFILVQLCGHKLHSDWRTQTTCIKVLSKSAATLLTSEFRYSPGHSHLWWPGPGERTHCRWGSGWPCASEAGVSPCRRSVDTKTQLSMHSQPNITTCSTKWQLSWFLLFLLLVTPSLVWPCRHSVDTKTQLNTHSQSSRTMCSAKW